MARRLHRRLGLFARSSGTPAPAGQRRDGAGLSDAGSRRASVSGPAHPRFPDLGRLPPGGWREGRSVRDRRPASAPPIRRGRLSTVESEATMALAEVARQPPAVYGWRTFTRCSPDHGELGLAFRRRTHTHTHPHSTLPVCTPDPPRPRGSAAATFPQARSADQAANSPRRARGAQASAATDGRIRIRGPSPAKGGEGRRPSPII